MSGSDLLLSSKRFRMRWLLLSIWFIFAAAAAWHRAAPLRRESSPPPCAGTPFHLVKQDYGCLPPRLSDTATAAITFVYTLLARSRLVITDAASGLDVHHLTDFIKVSMEMTVLYLSFVIMLFLSVNLSSHQTRAPHVSGQECLISW